MASYVTNKRTAHRWKLLTVMMIAVFCAFGSFWLLQAFDSDDAADALAIAITHAHHRQAAVARFPVVS